jgi:hypothetical protein
MTKPHRTGWLDYRRYATLGGVVLTVGTILIEGVDLWVGPMVDRMQNPRDDTVLQAYGTASRRSFSILNGQGETLTDCEATIRDSMGVEWAAPVIRELRADSRVDLAWTEFRHDGEPIDPGIARQRRVEVSCFVERLGGRRSALFERDLPRRAPGDSRPLRPSSSRTP